MNEWTTHPDLRESPEGRIVIERLGKLIEAVKYIEDKRAPEVFKEWCSQFGKSDCTQCRWNKLRKVYGKITTSGVLVPVTMGIRPTNPKVRLVEGNKRTAILVALNRPVPYKWEKTDGHNDQ